MSRCAGIREADARGAGEGAGGAAEGAAAPEEAPSAGAAGCLGAAAPAQRAPGAAAALLQVCTTNWTLRAGIGWNGIHYVLYKLKRV
jgi:hypothetical protein